MDLKHILNPMLDESPRIPSTTHSATPSYSNPSQNHLHPRFYLSPRRLDPETSSISTTSSTKRRRTNRGRLDIDRPLRSAAMGRSFSEIEVPSDTSSVDEDQDSVKRGVAQLSISGRSLGDLTNVEEHALMRLGSRVEALKSGTQGTWYVARIVEFASFPALYIDGPDAEPLDYPMVCVHYEGPSYRKAAYRRIFAFTLGLDSSVFVAAHVR